jgi:hypothetical protein
VRVRYLGVVLAGSGCVPVCLFVDRAGTIVVSHSTLSLTALASKYSMLYLLTFIFLGHFLRVAPPQPRPSAVILVIILILDSGPRSGPTVPDSRLLPRSRRLAQRDS